jgi:hypothetical protein
MVDDVVEDDVVDEDVLDDDDVDEEDVEDEDDVVPPGQLGTMFQVPVGPSCSEVVAKIQPR